MVKIIVIGLLQRQANLVRQACEKKLRGVEVDLLFLPTGGKRPVVTVPKADVAIETRFLGHKWHFKLERQFGGKVLSVHGGLGRLTETIVQLATKTSTTRARHLLHGDTKPRLAR